MGAWINNVVKIRKTYTIKYAVIPSTGRDVGRNRLGEHIMKNKIIAVATVAAVALSVTACGKNDTPAALQVLKQSLFLPNPLLTIPRLMGLCTWRQKP